MFVGPLPETPRGNKYIITATDYFSKWPEAAPLRDKTAVGVADFLFALFCRHGWPERIISDQGRVGHRLERAANMIIFIAIINIHIYTDYINNN